MSFDDEYIFDIHEGGEPEQNVTFDDEEPVRATRPPVSPKSKGKANIVVLGVGGAGSNAVSNMYKKGMTSATCVVMNTDLQALARTQVPAENKIQLGNNETGGLGAGSDPEVGKRAAIESKEIIRDALVGIDLLFIAAGMGGGTGTGAAPVIAEIAKSLGILTVGVVTRPFNFEGAHRLKNAEEGIKKLKDYVDTLLIISNQKLIDELDPNISFSGAFAVADEVLRQGVQGVSDLIAETEYINLDFADVRTVLSHKGYAYMGIGNGAGEKRIIDAVRSAVRSPLLETSIEGASALILDICGGEDLKLSEVYEACDLVRQVVEPTANIIFGMLIKPEKQDVSITIIATGFNAQRSSGVMPAFGYQSIAAADVQPAASASNDEDIFANRPVFNIKPAEAAQPVGATSAPLAPLPSEDAQPAYPQSNDRASSSRVAVPQRKVPMFLHRMKDNENSDK